MSHKRHRQYYQKENRELLTGIVVLSFVVLIIFAICYYFLVFSPSIEELNTKKTIKINEVNTIFKNNTEQCIESILYTVLYFVLVGSVL